MYKLELTEEEKNNLFVIFNEAVKSAGVEKGIAELSILFIKKILESKTEKP